MAGGPDGRFVVPVSPAGSVPVAAGSATAAAVAEARAAVDAVVTAVEGFDGPPAVAAALRRSAAALGAAAEHYPAEPADPVPVLPAGTPGWKEASHDAFFGIGRGSRSSGHWYGDRLRLFAAVATQVERGLHDRETVLAVLGFVSSQLDPPAPPEPGPGPRPGLDEELDTSPMAVWRRGHHFLATACVAARSGLEELERSVPSGDVARARRDIALTAQAIRAISASYALAGEFAGATYQGRVRPLMCPPHTPIEMNGALNLEYRAYLDRWRKVSELLREHRADFRPGGWPPQLVLPLETLFLTAVMEAHAHVTAAWRLVGSGTALHQHADAAEGGVVVLQTQVAARLADYREFVGL
jgi:hypothetical protein